MRQSFAALGRPVSPRRAGPVRFISVVFAVTLALGVTAFMLGATSHPAFAAGKGHWHHGHGGSSGPTGPTGPTGNTGATRTHRPCG